MAQGEQPEIDRDRLATLRELGEPAGDEFVADLVATFLADAAGHLAQIRAALSAADALALAEAAHTLKGCCANLGVAAMAATAQRLELIARGGSVDGGEALATELDSRFSRARALLREAAAGSTGESAR